MSLALAPGCVAMSGAVVHRDPRDCIAVAPTWAISRCRRVSQAFAVDTAGRSVARNLAAGTQLDPCLSAGGLAGLASTRRRAIFIDAREARRRLSTSAGQRAGNIGASACDTPALQTCPQGGIRQSDSRRPSTKDSNQRPPRPVAEGAISRACMGVAMRGRYALSSLSTGRASGRPRFPSRSRTGSEAIHRPRIADPNHRGQPLPRRKTTPRRSAAAYPHAFANDATRNRHGRSPSLAPARIAQRAPAIAAR